MIGEFDYSHAMELIHQIEERFEVESLTYSGVCFWPVLRVQIYHENLGLLSKALESRRVSFKRIKPFFSTYSRFLAEQLFDRENNLPKRKTSYPVFIFSSTTLRTTLYEGEWQNRLFSPIYIWLQESMPKEDIYFAEYSSNGNYFTPRSEATEYISYSLAWLVLKSRFRTLTLSAQNLDLLEQIHAFSSSLGGYTQCLAPSTVARRLSAFMMLRDYYLDNITRMKSQVIFVAPYYTLPSMALVHAGNTLGLTTIDIQHGMQGTQHVAYGAWKSMPKHGYACLPTHFWCWDEDSASNIRQWGRGHHTVLLGGNIQNEYWKDTVHKDGEVLQDKIQRSTITKVILVSLQTGLDDFAKEISASINPLKQLNCYWLIRLHPSMLGRISSITELFQSFNQCVDIELATYLPLSSVLSLTDLHVTMWSSVTIEAATYNIPTFLAKANCTLFSNLEKTGLLMRQKPEENLVNGLTRFISTDVQNPDLELSKLAISGKLSLKNLLSTAL